MQQFTRGGGGANRGTAVLLYRATFSAVQVDVTIQFVWSDSGYVHAGTIRTWMRTPDMMKDMLDMVNFVTESHSMIDALDTYDTIFRSTSRSSCSIDSSGSNNTHDPPHTKFRDVKYPRIDMHIVAPRSAVQAFDSNTFCEGIRSIGPAIECESKF
jgi:hypothetical protein